MHKRIYLEVSNFPTFQLGHLDFEILRNLSIRIIYYIYYIKI